LSTLTLAEAKDLLGASVAVSDPSLQIAIDDVESEIVRKYGPYAPGPVVEILRPTERQTRLILKRRVASVTSIKEWLTSNVVGGSSQMLDPADYRIVAGFQLERLWTGTHPLGYWSVAGEEVTYVPEDDTASRKIATVAVLRVELGRSGFSSRSIGDYSEATGSAGSGDDPDTTRARILRRLRPRKIVFA
jgi:hypothetical protein